MQIRMRPFCVSQKFKHGWCSSGIFTIIFCCNEQKFLNHYFFFFFFFCICACIKWLKLNQNSSQNKPFLGLTNLHKLFWAFYFCKIIIITKTCCSCQLKKKKMLQISTEKLSECYFRVVVFVCCYLGQHVS